MRLCHCFQRHGDATEARHRVRRARGGAAAHRPGLHPRLQVRLVTRVSKIGQARVVNFEHKINEHADFSASYSLQEENSLLTGPQSFIMVVYKNFFLKFS